MRQHSYDNDTASDIIGNVIYTIDCNHDPVYNHSRNYYSRAGQELRGPNVKDCHLYSDPVLYSQESEHSGPTRGVGVQIVMDESFIVTVTARTAGNETEERQPRIALLLLRKASRELTL